MRELIAETIAACETDREGNVGALNDLAAAQCYLGNFVAGERDLSQGLFRRALTLSEANELPKFNHPWIAEIQVQAGLLGEAYRTIQLVEEPADRVGPLSELCKALAKAEYLAGKAERGNKP